MRVERFYAGVAVLSLITIVVLGFCVWFLSADPVQMQISEWARQVARKVGLNEPASAPLPTQSALAAADLKPSATPSATPSPTAQPTLENTPTPIIQVIEDPIPEGSLVIKKLNIDKPVVPVHVKDEIWDLETLGADIGWLETTGSYPNDDLAMVFVGHVTLPPPGGGVGPFLDLGSLWPGDRIIYETAEQTYTYEVKSQAIVNPDQAEVLYRPDGSTLLLVTCTGYNPLEWSYDLRLVVEAVLVNTEVKTALE